MFQQLIASNPSRAATKPVTLFVSTALHGFFIVGLVVVPLIRPSTLVGLQVISAPPPPMSAPRRAVVRLETTAAQSRPVVVRPVSLTAPAFIPPRIDLSALGSSDPVGVPGDIPESGSLVGGTGGGGAWLEGLPDSSPRSVPLPRPPSSAERVLEPINRIRQGGEVQHANLLHQVKPTYPRLAIISRVQGSVILEAVIDREGRVKNLTVLSGHPLLVRTAFEAVQQWRYRPTLLNGQPVEVLTQVTVSFSLGGIH
jgi:protein TonB